MPSNHVFMLHEDPTGVLWVGTSHGLVQFDGERAGRKMTIADGLISNTVFSMDTQPQGWLWIGSFGGLSRLAR